MTPIDELPPLRPALGEEDADALVTLQAMLHHVQARMLSAAVRGNISTGVRAECASMLRCAADVLDRGNHGKA